MKSLLLYTFLAVSQSASCQGNFTLEYELVGLGSNRHTIFYPSIKVEGKHMTYVVENRKCTVEIRQSSLDSISNIVSVINDTAIFKSNPCIMSGAVSYLSVRTREKRLRLTLVNTIDLTSLGIIRILNTYLPAGEKIRASDQLVKRAEDCLESLRRSFRHSTNH
jgi:hypothetical protein